MKCSAWGCDRGGKIVKGYCTMHWQRLNRHGDPYFVKQIKDGRKAHPFYALYNQMIQRCENPNHPRYADWGGRGITVCESWRINFWFFVADMGDRPEGYMLDRIDNDDGYYPTNCRWVTASESNRNRRPQRRAA